MARRGPRALGLTLVLALLGAVGAAGADGGGLPAQAPVAPGKLTTVTGTLRLAYEGPEAATGHRADGVIQFRFAKPFRLWLREASTGLEVTLDGGRARLFEPARGRVVEADLSDVLRNRWLAHAVAALDLGAFVDPEAQPRLRTGLDIGLHRGPALPDVQPPSWKPTPPPPGEEAAREGDWLVMAPRPGSLHQSFLGLGRVALRVGGELGIPREFRYYERLDDSSFRLSLVVSIPRLQFNVALSPEAFAPSAPPGTRVVRAADLLFAMALERVWRVGASLRRGLAGLWPEVGR